MSTATTLDAMGRIVPAKLPCEICGELTTFREGKENTVRRHGGHVQGPHHTAYAICDRRVAEGWLPLTRSLERAAIAGGWLRLLVRWPRIALEIKSPLEWEGQRVGPLGGRANLFWGRESDLADLVENLSFDSAEQSFFCADITRLKRTAARCNAREPWWIAWKQSSLQQDFFSYARVATTDNTPKPEQRGDLTP